MSEPPSEKPRHGGSRYSLNTSRLRLVLVYLASVALWYLLIRARTAYYHEALR